MIENLLRDVLQYAGYAAELGILVCLIWRRSWKRDASLGVYALFFLLIDGVTRPYVLYHYGLSSKTYAYCYWGTDVLLTLAAFLLITFFFRRACAKNKDLWPMLRLMLAGVLVLISLISYFSLIHHYDHLFTRFIVEFQQNLYFACLVLNTLLYIMLAQQESGDEELSLLVCGLGIEFAGPAAGMALMYLTPGGRDAGFLLYMINPLCNLGMCLLWLYAITRKPQEVSVNSAENYAESSGPRRSMGAFGEAPVSRWGEV